MGKLMAREDWEQVLTVPLLVKVDEEGENIEANLHKSLPHVEGGVRSVHDLRGVIESRTSDHWTLQIPAHCNTMGQ